MAVWRSLYQILVALWIWYHSGSKSYVYKVKFIWILMWFDYFLRTVMISIWIYYTTDSVILNFNSKLALVSCEQSWSILNVFSIGCWWWLWCVIYYCGWESHQFPCIQQVFLPRNSKCIYKILCPPILCLIAESTFSVQCKFALRTYFTTYIFQKTDSAGQHTE